MLHKIPYDGEHRVETGAVQFGDDWPGIFIRGDNCMGLACSLSYIREAIEMCPDETVKFMARQGLGYLSDIENREFEVGKHR